MGGEIVANETFGKGDTDFRGQLTKLKKVRREGVYIPAYFEDVARIAEQAREVRLKAVLLGGDGWDSDTSFALGGKAVEGSYITNHYAADDQSPRVQAFIKAYQARFNAVPDSNAALADEAAGMLFAAMERASDLSGPKLRDEITKTKGFPGVTGTITLDENRNPVKPAFIVVVRDGRFRYHSVINPKAVVDSQHAAVDRSPEFRFRLMASRTTGRTRDSPAHCARETALGEVVCHQVTPRSATSLLTVPTMAAVRRTRSILDNAEKR